MEVIPNKLRQCVSPNNILEVKLKWGSQKNATQKGEPSACAKEEANQPEWRRGKRESFEPTKKN
jgi:hypothetical protein